MNVDWNQLEAIAGAWDAEILDIYAEFLKAAAEDLEGLRSAIEAGDPTQAAALAHRIKGSSGIFGFKQLQDAVAVIEDAGRAGTLDGCAVQFEAAMNGFSMARAEVAARVPAAAVVDAGTPNA